MKNFIFTIVLIILSFLGDAVASGNNHNHNHPVTNATNTETTTTVHNTVNVTIPQVSEYTTINEYETINNYRTIEKQTGVALSTAAGSIICDTGTTKKQFSAGFAGTNQSTAFAAGTCGSIADDITLKINGSKELRGGDNSVLNATFHFEW